MDIRDLITTGGMDGVAIAAAVIGKVSGAGGPRAATTAVTDVVEQIYEYDDPGIINASE